MRNWIIIVLWLACLPAWAAPRPFSANFSQPVIEGNEDDGRAWGWEKNREGQLVFLLNKRVSLPQLRAYVAKTMPSGLRLAQETKVLVNGYPALQWEGMNENGIPYQLVMVSTPTRSYFCGSVTFDTALNREFVRSFKLKRV